MRLELHNDVAQLLVFVLELSLECLQSHLVYLRTLHLHLLKLRRIKSVAAFKLGCAELNLQAAQLLLGLSALALLLKKQVPQLTSFPAMTLHELLDQLLVPAVHCIHISLLLGAQSITLMIERLLYFAL